MQPVEQKGANTLSYRAMADAPVHVHTLELTTVLQGWEHGPCSLVSAALAHEVTDGF